MSQEAKIITAIGILTLAVIVGGLLFLGKTSQTTPPPGTNGKVDQNLLVRADSNKIATDSAKVTLVEFGDYQCPACATAQPIVEQIIAEHRDKLTFVFRNFPLFTIHKNAKAAAEAAEAAGEQGKYWEMNSLLYENQVEWSESGNPVDLFVKYAQQLGLDTNKLKKEIQDNKFNDKIQQGITDGNKLGVNATPTFFVNGSKFTGSTLNLKTTIDGIINK